jgi:hypothetical protein
MFSEKYKLKFYVFLAKISLLDFFLPFLEFYFVCDAFAWIYDF